MDIKKTKEVLQLIQDFQNQNYFYDEESIKSKINERDNRISTGEDGPQLKMQYPDNKIRSVIRRNTRKHMQTSARTTIKAIEEKDIKTLVSRIRYDQKFMKALFKVVTGITIKNTNKAIKEQLTEFCNNK